MSFLKKLFGRRNNKNDTSPSLEVIVNEYGACLAKSKTVERDINELPFSKEVIERGLLQAIEMTPRGDMREHLRTGYVQLADFQDLESLRSNGQDAAKVISDEAALRLAQVS